MIIYLPGSFLLVLNVMMCSVRTWTVNDCSRWSALVIDMMCLTSAAQAAATATTNDENHQAKSNSNPFNLWKVQTRTVNIIEGRTRTYDQSSEYAICLCTVNIASGRCHTLPICTFTVARRLALLVIQRVFFKYFSFLLWEPELTEK